MILATLHNFLTQPCLGTCQFEFQKVESNMLLALSGKSDGIKKQTNKQTIEAIIIKFGCNIKVNNHVRSIPHHLQIISLRGSSE